MDDEVGGRRREVNRKGGEGELDIEGVRDRERLGVRQRGKERERGGERGRERGRARDRQ